jgi:hypothetical protein
VAGAFRHRVSALSARLAAKNLQGLWQEPIMNKLWLGLGAAAAVNIHGPALAHACSVCLTGDSGPVSDAYNWSILFLMATPYTVMGSVGAWLVYKYRTAAKQPLGERDEPLRDLALDYKESGR